MRNERVLRKGVSWALIAALTLTLINVGSPRAGATSLKLDLTNATVVNESVPPLGDATMIVDEQTDAGDPRGGTGGTTLVDTKWHAGWGSGAVNASAYIDLGQDYVLTDIYLRDANDSGNLVVSAGTPGSWTPLFTDPLTQYNQWVGHSVNVTTRYVRVTRATATSNFYELVLYGSPATVDVDPPAASTLAADSATTTTTTIPINWTAPGDDGSTGTAAEYDIRYYTSNITTGNWGDASPVNDEPTPSSAGSFESYTLTGLSPNTTYYIAMKTRDEANNESALSNVLTVSTLAIGGPPGQIILTSDMLLDERGIDGGKGRLVDDQAASSPRTAKEYRWNAGNNDKFHPASVVIDLGADYALTSIDIYDSNGSGPLVISTGTPFSWTTQFTDPMTRYNEGWTYHAVSTTTRYVRLSVNNDGPWIAEIKLFGSQVGLPPVEPVPIAPAPPIMNDFIGINAFVDDPLSVTQVAKFIREYHNWNWDEGDVKFGTTGTYPGYPNNQNKFAPSWAGGGGWNFDSYYGGLKSAGITVAPAIKGSTAWITAKSGNKPLFAAEDSYSPASYIEHADHMYQFAARYGSTAIADGNLKLAPGQPRSTGLDKVKYFENGNEPDNTWDPDDDFYYTPYEFTAMSSADYDGHLGTLGNTIGVKNADPNAKMVMAGLSDPKMEYLRGIKFWADYNRGGDLPFDVINFHYYSHDGEFQSDGTVGVSPEEDGMKDKLSEIVQFRNKYYPDKEVWITEFGYDTDLLSTQRVPVIAGQTLYQTQANWIIRSYLAAAAAGIDKAAMYMLRDVKLAPNEHMEKFYASGLVGRQDLGYPKKDSWYYLYTFRNALGDMHYIGEQESNSPNVLIYKFKSATSNAGAYVVWKDTSTHSHTNGYSLALQGNPTSASQIEMVDEDIDGLTTALTISGDKKVTIDVSEKPLIVLVNHIQ